MALTIVGGCLLNWWPIYLSWAALMLYWAVYLSVSRLIVPRRRRRRLQRMYELEQAASRVRR